MSRLKITNMKESELYKYMGLQEEFQLRCEAERLEKHEREEYERLKKKYGDR